MLRLLTIALIVAAVGVSANAALVMDMRFSGGGTNVDLDRNASINADYTVQVWAKVTGSGAGAEGITYSYGAAQSVQVGGGALIGATGVGITASTLNSAFDTGAQVGAASNTTGDSIADWGTASVATSSVKYSADVSNSTSATSGVTSNAITNGTEFLVGSFTIHVITTGATAGDVTKFQWVRPSWASPSPKYQTTYPDGAGDTNNASYSSSNGMVTFTLVPEPVTLALLGMGGIGLLARRRR